MTPADLPHGWRSPNGGDQLWGHEPHRTYKSVPYELLPPITALDGTFAWLPELGPDWKPMALVRDCEEDPAAVARHLTGLIVLGCALPPAFVTFLSTPRLAARMPNYTGCYFELGEHLEVVPERPERLLRFMVDPQCCVWSLLVGPERQRVVMARPDDRNRQALVDHTVCAESFEEFLKRFWIESQLAWTLQRGETPVGELREYLEAASRAQATRTPRDRGTP